MKGDTNAPDKLLLNIREVSELTGFSVGTIYHFVSELRIPFVRISSRCLRFERNALAAWIEQMTVPVCKERVSKFQLRSKYEAKI